ncbi:MAG: energy transducer TonB, partial [Bacteroidota bacterium]
PEGVDASLLESGDGLTGEEATEIVTFAEQMPEFPGGQEAMMAFLSKNIQYPPMARENGIEGRVVLQFVVDKDGKISNIEIVKKLGWGLEEEATRVVKTMPAWKPAKQNGKPVVLRMILPIVFKLQ